MERLTYKVERKRGGKWERGYYTKHNKQKLINVLAAYEDTGLTPEQIREIDCLHAEKCREMAELRQKKEKMADTEQGDLFIDDMLLPEPYRPESKTPEEMQEWKERMLRNFLRGHV